MELLRCGDGGVLGELGRDDPTPLALVAALDAAPPAGLVDLVPAARTVLVRFDRAVTSHAAVGAALRAVAEGARRGAGPSDGAAAPVALRVAYDGEDLADVAAETGLDVEEVVRRHVAADYVVACCGFAPGFGYLAGGDPALVVSRARTPRTRVPAGSVGLAGSFTGAYPRASPGGWRLIGRTDAALFDPGRTPPALLAPGARVRMERVAEVGEVPRVAGGRPLLARGVEAALEVLAPGALALVQDAGRPGHGRIGVGPSGAADRVALARANRLVGNPGGAAAIEAVLGGLVLRARRDLLVAVCGARVGVRAGGRAEATDALVRLRAGDELRLDAPPTGLRAYVAVRGGLDVPRVLGGAGTDVLAGLGPRPLAAGDGLAVGPPDPTRVPLLAQVPVASPSAAAELVARPGPREAWFHPDALATLARGRYEVTAHADRVGLRLDGPALPRLRDEELPSEGMVPGALQVPPDGRPVLFGADHPVTGGYPVVAVLDDLSIARAAQLRPGDVVRFRVRP